jgi:hypothetical protein
MVSQHFILLEWLIYDSIFEGMAVVIFSINHRFSDIWFSDNISEHITTFELISK